MDIKTLFALGLVFGLAPLSAKSAEQDFQVDEISVLGQSGKRSAFDSLPSVTKVSGTELDRKRKSTLGETLSREAGVSATFFGPNSSRPVIRGLDGDRVRMLENGVGLLDASSASPDHAVAIDPLLVDSIEILRGPSALLYGSSAVGGVVNVRTNRIAEARLDAGRFDLNPAYNSVDQGKSLGALARKNLGDFVLHVDASIRSSENYAIPGFARTLAERDANPLAPGEEEESGTVGNSTNRTSQAAIGISRPLENGFIGAAVSGYLSEYGTVAEKSVIIDMDRVRLDAAGELRGALGLDSIRFKSAFSKYEHTEMEDGEVGTIFRNRGVESRVDAKKGSFVFGAQHQYFRLSAVGDEAFLPTTRNSSLAGFGLWEESYGRVKPSFGLRLDSAGVESETSDLFGAGASKMFFAPSASLGVQVALNESVASGPAFSAGLNATYTERAPNYQELFANGAHVATGIFERGNNAFSTEKNVGLEASLKVKDQVQDARFSMFLQDFRNYIALSPTGEPQIDGLDVYQFNQVRARLFGAELEYRYRLQDMMLAGNWDLDFKADWVRGLDLTNGGALPRMVPIRGTLGVNYRNQAFSAGLEYQRTEGQNQVAANERATRGYNFVNLSGEVPFTTSFGLFKALLRVNNLFDVEARNHISFVKEIAPLPGRNVFVGLQAAL
ncbi:MAG: TonB-dependent receptor [Bdellovibrionales bacterium]|nr:TonB-dependent receptor [Bdellovibrionales bacterium]